MDEFLTHVAAEWTVIAKAPVVFLAALLAVAGIIYWALNMMNGGKISLLEERLKLRDDQIGDLQSKVGTTSPDEIRARIKTLEDQVDALAPRRISAAKRSGLAALLKARPGHIEIVQDMAVPDAQPYAADLAAVFQDAGWRVMVPKVLGHMNPPMRGLGLLVYDPENPTESQKLISEAFHAFAIPFDLQKGGIAHGLKGVPPFDASILVTQKVT